MYAEPRRRKIPGDGIDLQLLDWGGDGPPILFLHGGSAHAHWWDFVAPAFTDRFHAYALDLRGHGDSGWSPEGAYHLADYAAGVRAWMAHDHAARPVLVGHSLGSFVALRYAIDRPDDVAALVVVDGRASFSASGSRYMRLLRAIGPAEYATLEEATRRFHLLPAETVADTRVLEHVARRSFRQASSGLWVAKFDRATLGAHEPFDFRDALGSLSSPVLFVRGENSGVLSRDAAARFAAACRAGASAEIPGAYHHVPLDRPRELAAEITRFLHASALL